MEWNKPNIACEVGEVWGYLMQALHEHPTKGRLGWGFRWLCWLCARSFLAAPAGRGVSEGGKKETPECEANASVILHTTGLSQPRQYLSKYLLVIGHLILVVRVCYMCPLAKGAKALFNCEPA